MKVLESMPPELYADIVKNGIYLAGGGALIKGLDRRLNGENRHCRSTSPKTRCAPLRAVRASR